MGVALAAISLRRLLRCLVGVAYQYFVRELVGLSHTDKIAILYSLLWFYEVGNGLLVAHRRKRIVQDQIEGFPTRWKNLPIEVAAQVPTDDSPS